MKQNSSSFVNNLYYAKWMRMLLMPFMLLLSSSLYATTFYIQGSSWLNLSNSNTIMTESGSTYTYTYTFTSDNTGSGQWFKIFKDNQNNDQNYMLFYNGSEKDNVPLNKSLSCSIGGYAEFKMSVEKGFIYNITVTYTSTSNVKLLITATEPIVITPNKEAPYYLKDQITLTAKGGKGGSGDYEWYKKEPSDSDYTQIAGAYNATYSFTLDGSYIYKVVDTTTGVESTIDIKPSVRCDEANTKVIFSEDFGWLDIKERAESEYAKYSYKAACTSIKNGGEYAIVAVPVWGGCNVEGGNDYTDPCFCPAYKSPEERGNINMWFNEKLDHATEESYLKALKESHPLYSEEEIQQALEAFRTDFATNESVRQTYSVAPQSAKDNNKLYGGMLLFNCKGGSDDILYERKIDVCDNTYINFSAWFTKANVSNADKIGAKFVLLNGSTRGELDSYTVENIDVNAGWKQVSAMFNSKNCGGSVIVQLINYAPAGDKGNDLLVDDISLSVCTPDASLLAEYVGVQTDNVQAMIGEQITLFPEIDNVVFSGDPYYWWQQKEEGATKWTGITAAPEQGKTTCQVMVGEKKTEYRVIVANTKQTAIDAADDLAEESLCGLYSVTNSVIVEPILLTLNPTVASESICANGTNTYTLNVANTSDAAINGVYAQVVIPAGVKAYKFGTETAFDGNWNIGNLAANTGKAELKITLESTGNVTETTPLSIKAYVSAIGTKSWSNYESAAIKKEISFELKPVPSKPTLLKSSYTECALTGTDTKVLFSTFYSGTGITVYSDKELQHACPDFDGAIPTNKQIYYANQTIDGCTGDTAHIAVTVRELPVLKTITVDDEAICTGGSTNIHYTIDGGVGQYTLTMKTDMNGKVEKSDIAELGKKDVSGVTYFFPVTPTSEATFSFTHVKDAYCTNTVDENLSVTVDVKSINITKQPYITNLPICADTKAELKVDTEGDDLQYQWYESTDGNKYTLVGENKNTHTTGQLIKADDKKYSYKVVVSQSPKVCEQIESKPVEVNVNDCSEFLLEYTANPVTEVCKGGNVTLTLTLTNTSETMDQTGVEVTITGLADQTFELPASVSKQKEQFIWSVGTLAKERKNKLTITLTNVEKSFNSSAYVSRSGTNEYTASETVAIASNSMSILNKPSFTLNETTLGELCAGTALELPTITVENGGTAITSQGWYLVDPSTSDEQGITAINELSDDAHNGKELWYKATNDCGTESKRYTTLSVKDCADFTLTYLLSNANPCAGDTITLTATITNDGDASLSGVNLWQTWSGNQGVVDNVKQFDYDMGDYQNGKWEIATFPSKATATLTITFIAQANEEFKMHVTESNGIPYDSWENSPAKDVQKLTVSPISDPVVFNETVNAGVYNSCALASESPEKLMLSSLVKSDKTKLQYYEMNAEGVWVALTEEPSIPLNQAFGPKTYGITNEEEGKCPSEIPTKVTVQVLAKPTISLTEEDVTLNCNNQTQTVTVSGASTYKWTDANGPVTTDDELNLSPKDDSPRTYTVVGYSADNCASDALTLTVKEDFVAPDAKISMPSGSYAINDSTLTCTLTSLELTASSTVSGVTYKWNDTSASTSSSITVDKANVYQVTVTNPNNGCSASAVKTILSNTKVPIVSVSVLDAAGKPATALTCAADKDTLSLVPSIDNETEIGNTNITYTWSANVIGVDNKTHAAKVDEKGKYSVTVKGDNGCSVTEYVEIDADQTKPVLSIASSNDTLTCLLPDAKLTATVSNVEMQSYSWTKKDDAGLSNVGSDAVITVSDSAKYFVTATAVNGCVEKDSIVVPQRTDLPKVEIASTDEVQYCRINTLTASGALTYVWSTGSDKASIEVSEAGTYTVTGTNQYGCAKDTSIVLKDRKILPTIKLTTDTTTITCKKPEVTISSEITNKIEDRTYSYVWKNEAGTIVGNGTSKAVSDDKKYTVFVTDKTSDCVGEASKKLIVNKQEPMVDVVMLPGVCLPASIDLTDAIGENTLADTVVFYTDEGLTQQITETAFEVEQYHVYYAQGQHVAGNGCMGKAQSVAVNLKPATPAPTVKDYDECVKAESETFSPLVTSESYKLTFYDVAQGGTPIADAFDASDANTTTTYYVTNTNQGACESERTAFTVHIEGLVDFDLAISEDKVMVGGEDVVVTLTPAEVEVDSYKWMANDKVLEVEGEEYVTKPYVDTKFVVAAKGRCNTLSKEVDVEVVWPTAFTPYNNNGLNETFAKGFELDVYNRFGVQIFKGTDGWDGVMNQNMGANEMAMPGVYYYAVFLPDGNVKKGTIEIVKF